MKTPLFIESKLDEIVLILNSFAETNQTVTAKIELASSLISAIHEVPVLQFGEDYNNEVLNLVLGKWISGDSINSLKDFEGIDELISDIFSFKLPWVLNGIGKKLRNKELEAQAELVEEISMLIEVGLPDLKAVKIYQAGIRSRVSAKELSDFFQDEIWEKSIKQYKNEILENQEFYKLFTSPACGEWIELLVQTSKSKMFSIDRISNFTFGDANKFTSKLIAKEINGKHYLVSPDLSFVRDVSGGEVDFSSITKVNGVYFNYDKEDNFWKMIIDNPYVDIN